MAEVTLNCAVYADVTMFRLTIAVNAYVSELQQAVFENQRHRDRFKFPASHLKLYLARKKNRRKKSVWLANDGKLKTFLRKSDVDKEYKEMNPLSPLNQYFGADFQPPEGKIHVLVELPDVQETALPNKKQRLDWQSTRWGSHDYDPNSQFFLLEQQDADKSGLLPVRMKLYCRPIFHRQFEFLRDEVLSKGHLGWILGPTGTGKSTTAMAFMSTLNRSEWMVTWIHVGKIWRCVRLIGDERKSRFFQVSDLDEVLMDDDTRHHVVLVDGWTASEGFDELTGNASDGSSKEKKVQEDLEFVTGAKELFVWSWTLEEYLNAINDDEVFEMVSQNLDAPAVLTKKKTMTRAVMVESKYYYAGGSCRYMFQFNTETVATKLSDAVDALDDAKNDATSGQRSSLSINRLSGMFKRPNDVGAVYPVISQYAGTLIAVKCGPKAIKRFMSTRRDSSNPALNGWMLEMVFFASLRNGGLDLIDAAGNVIEKWNQSDLIIGDKIPKLPSAHPVWIKSLKWNQGGYDAIMVCKSTQHVRFVQVTSADTHSFHIEDFSEWLNLLSMSQESFEVKKLEIIFVIDQDKLDDFKFTTVTGTGLLEPFDWPKGKETDLVRRVGIRNLYNLSL
ncbi:hypothetical protein Ae201684P_001796 [Aphanomyces euteiches]|nr:hypothetical protein Ae201684P_001796 [Aphanomyces euteiches]